MLSQYAAHFGILVTYGEHTNPISAIVFAGSNGIEALQGLGFQLNTNHDPAIPVTRLIRGNIEDVVGDYRTRNDSNQDVRDIFFKLGEVGKVYVYRQYDTELENFTKPILFISNEVVVDPNLWEEIPTFKAREMINFVTKSTAMTTAASILGKEEIRGC